MSSVTLQKLEEHRAESGKVAGIGNELRSANDEPGGYNKEQEQSDVNASENVRPLSAWGNGNFAGKNGTNEHGGKCITKERHTQVCRFGQAKNTADQLDDNFPAGCGCTHCIAVGNLSFGRVVGSFDSL